jgi:hypothetical protein
LTAFVDLLDDNEVTQRAPNEIAICHSRILDGAA